MSFDFNNNIHIPDNAWADDLHIVEALYYPVLSKYNLGMSEISKDAYKLFIASDDAIMSTFYNHSFFRLFCELYQIDKDILCNHSFDIMDIFLKIFPDMVNDDHYTQMFKYPGIKGVYEYSAPQPNRGNLVISNLNIDVILAYIRFIAKNFQKYRVNIDTNHFYNISFYNPDEYIHFKMGGSYSVFVNLSKEELVHLVLGLYYSCHLFTDVIIRQNATCTILDNLKKYINPERWEKHLFYVLQYQSDLNSVIESLYQLLWKYKLVSLSEDIKYKKIYADGF